MNQPKPENIYVWI